MPVASLSSQHFALVGQQKRVMVLQVPGVVLVMFKTRECPSCKSFEPTFVQLSNNDNRVVYAVADLTANRNIGMMSMNSTTPLQKVPMLIIYNEGRPYAKFNGKRDIPSLKAFISKALIAINGGGAQPSNAVASHSRAVQPRATPAAASSGRRGKIYNPDIGPTPQGRTAQGYTLDTEDPDESLMIPKEIIPHNIPWETLLKD
jgi:thiol-disulfide isomerase/thioredoxin